MSLETASCMPGGRLEQRAVVADAERGAAPGPGEEALDELEFAEGGHVAADYRRRLRGSVAGTGQYPVAARRTASLQ